MDFKRFCRSSAVYDRPSVLNPRQSTGTLENPELAVILYAQSQKTLDVAALD